MTQATGTVRTAGSTNNSTTDTTARRIVLDLGKQGKSKVRQLRDGHGPLMADVDAEIARLREGGEIPKGPVVVFVVREKKKKDRWIW